MRCLTVGSALVSTAAGWSASAGAYDSTCSVNQMEMALFIPQRAAPSKTCLAYQEEDEFWKPRPNDLNVVLIEDDGEESDDEDADDYLYEEEEDDDFDEEHDDWGNDWDETYEGDEDHEGQTLASVSPQTNRQQNTDRGEDFGVPQYYDAPEVARWVQKAREYIEKEVMIDEFYTPVRKLCVNKDPNCAFWASIGECQQNPSYMNQSCAPVCQACGMLHVKTRCVVDPNATDALYPGDLNKMFERIVTDPKYKPWKPIVLSRPEFADGDTAATAEYQLGMWLIQFDNFATLEECDRLVEIGGVIGYNRSADVGEELEDGTFGEDINSGRTSTNAWCNDACYNDTLAKAVILRMENITGIPETNAEFLQLLRYEEGQYYQTHNDYIPYQIERPTGVRILTFYVYLNDVEEGGDTEFPRLGLRVQPKKGRAVLWPSVHDQFPNHVDVRSEHQAMPVVRGIKYGANAWYHQRDVKGDPTGGLCQ